MRALTKRQPIVVSYTAALRENAVSALGITNGARQSRHCHNALQAVEPKCDTSRVLLKPQHGHAIDSRARGTKRTMRSPSAAAPVPQRPGGAMPYARRLSRAAAVIQSVVQAGANCVTTRPGTPRRCRVAWMSSAIWAIAGQPL